MWHSPPTNTSKIPGLFHPGDSEGQGSLVCCSPWGRSQTQQSDWTTAVLIYEDPWDEKTTHRRLSAHGVRNSSQGLGDLNACREFTWTADPGDSDDRSLVRLHPASWLFLFLVYREMEELQGHCAPPELPTGKWWQVMPQKPTSHQGPLHLLGQPSPPDKSLNVPPSLFFFFNTTKPTLRLSLKEQQNQTLY